MAVKLRIEYEGGLSCEGARQRAPDDLSGEGGSAAIFWSCRGHYAAVGQAVGRFSKRLVKEPALLQQMEHLKAQLSNVET